jgi:signal transduction histidine kinase
LTRPLKTLQQASRKLAEGELGTRIEVPVQGGDESAELGRAFNSMAQQLEEKVEAQKQLLSDVSHELRSPLARLRVALALAEKDPASSGRHLQRMEQETERFDELIAQLLSLPEKNIELQDSLDLVTLSQALCEDARFEAQSREQTVTFNSSIGEAIVSTHADLLKKALDNVIRNALHYSPDGGLISVELQPLEAGFRLSIADSGPGVAETDLDKIFQPFYRTDRARQRETGGHGLGLAIAYRAVVQHAGSIIASNTEHGLLITIELPVAPEA